MTDYHPPLRGNPPKQGGMQTAVAATQPMDGLDESASQPVVQEVAPAQAIGVRESPALAPGDPPTSMRTTRRTVTFSRPFMLSGIGGIQPAGTYTVETDEELIQEISFPAYRRTATLMLLPPQSNGPILAQIATIDPVELEVALERDAMNRRP